MNRFKSVRKLVREIAWTSWGRSRLPVRVWVLLTNLVFFRRPTRLRVSQEGDIAVFSDNEVLSLSRKTRVKNYRFGLERRLRDLAGEYFCEDVGWFAGRLVVDCGSNIGEFAVWADRNGSQVIAFEPDPHEFSVCLRNAGSQTTVVRVALTDRNGSAPFFPDNDTGDSSLIRGSRSQSISVEVRTLDDFLLNQVGNVEIVDLLKIDAEGNEPEVLRGATEILARTKFVTLDMGPERGSGQDNTLVECLKILSGLGFQMERFNEKRIIGMFRNNGLVAQGERRPW